MSSVVSTDFSLDAALTRSADSVGSPMLAALAIELPEATQRSWVYRFEGSLDDAFSALEIPQGARVRPPAGQPVSMVLSLALELGGDSAAERLGSEWLGRARALADELSGASQHFFAIEFTDPPEREFEKVARGSQMRIFSLEGYAPYFDLGGLELMEGTFLKVAELTFPVPDGGLDELFEDDWTVGGADARELGVPLPAGAEWVDSSEVKDLLFGDESYLAPGTVAGALRFYSTLDRLRCPETDRSFWARDDGDVEVTTITCLDHAGEEPKAGDEVIEIKLVQAWRDLVTEALGWQEGPWIVLMIDRWIEEEY